MLMAPICMRGPAPQVRDGAAGSIEAEERSASQEHRVDAGGSHLRLEQHGVAVPARRHA